MRVGKGDVGEVQDGLKVARRLAEELWSPSLYDMSSDGSESLLAVPMSDLNSTAEVFCSWAVVAAARLEGVFYASSLSSSLV